MKSRLPDHPPTTRPATRLAGAGFAELEVKGSRFRAACMPCADLAAALALVVRHEHVERRATHLCWAARVATPQGIAFRAHDAGEPSGTAGRPILAALEERGVVDAVIVVARVFGGVKLGAGGLKRAYHRVALQAVGAAPLREPEVAVARRRMRIPYGRLAVVQRLAAESGGTVRGRSYGEHVEVEVESPPDEIEQLCQRIMATAGETH